MFVNIRPDKAIKHFTAYDPVAKWTTGHVVTKATATSAKALLDKLIAEAPFAIEGIQVDGGSEFKVDFERACKANGLNLYVLPPRSPKLNGAVERNQGAWRYEFYASGAWRSPPQPISKPSAAVLPRLIYPELGQSVALGSPAWPVREAPPTNGAAHMQMPGTFKPNLSVVP